MFVVLFVVTGVCNERLYNASERDELSDGVGVLTKESQTALGMEAAIAWKEGKQAAQ